MSDAEVVGAVFAPFGYAALIELAEAEWQPGSRRVRVDHERVPGGRACCPVGYALLQHAPAGIAEPEVLTPTSYVATGLLAQLAGPGGPAPESVAPDREVVAEFMRRWDAGRIPFADFRSLVMTEAFDRQLAERRRNGEGRPVVPAAVEIPSGQAEDGLRVPDGYLPADRSGMGALRLEVFPGGEVVVRDAEGGVLGGVAVHMAVTGSGTRRRFLPWAATEGGHSGDWGADFPRRDEALSVVLGAIVPSAPL